MSTHLQQLQAERTLVDAAMIVETEALAVWSGYKARDTAGALTSTTARSRRTVGALRARAWALDVEMEWLTR